MKNILFDFSYGVNLSNKFSGWLASFKQKQVV